MKLVCLLIVTRLLLRSKIQSPLPKQIGFAIVNIFTDFAPKAPMNDAPCTPSPWTAWTAARCR